MSGITPGQTYSPAIATVGRKDAFHVPCVLCRVHPDTVFPLDAGDQVCIVRDCEADFAGRDDEHYDGVVDPFLEKTIYKSSKDLFWVFLRPDRVTELTHTFRILPPTEAETDAETEEKSESTPPDDGDWDAACRKCNS